MKNLIVIIINKLDAIEESNPKLFKIGLIALWCIAPIEMACIKLGMFGYKKFKERYFMTEQIQEDLR